MNQIHRVPIDSHEIHVEIIGTGSPILLINGLGGNPDNFSNIKQSLSGHQIITYDPPGVGQSSNISMPMRMSGHAKIVNQLVRELGYSSIDILGVSWGGALAQEIAFRHPETVKNLILVSTTAGPGVLVNPITLFQRYFKMLMGTKTEWLQIGTILGWTSLGYLKKIRHPTLIVTGTEDDLILPYNAKLLKCLIPDSRLEIIDDSDHWLILHQADELAGIIRNFLK